MKKILPILVISIFVLGSLPLALADGGVGDEYHYDALPEYRGDMPYHEGWWYNFTTNVTLEGGGSSDPAIIKAKWETPDEDLTRNLSQINPVPGDNKTVTYHAVVKKGTGDINNVWAEVYHPDGTYKYEVLLVGLDEQTAVSMWQQVTGTNVESVTFNIPYFEQLFGYTPTIAEMVANILNELQQRDVLYRGSANLSYCQPAGWYTVGAIAHDSSYGWCDPLWNHFWYIPYAAYTTDFQEVDWGTIQAHSTEWVDGDYSMNTPTQPSIKNIGNCPINLNISNTDMGFGWNTLPPVGWNVYFDVRLGHEVTAVEYEPIPAGGHPGDIGTDIPGGPIPLCTIEKIDFSIHIRKPTLNYAEGCMWLTAYIDPDPFTQDYWTPEPFRGIEPGFMAGLTIPMLSPLGYAEPTPLPTWTHYP
jgi:hypothetical protein